MTYIYLALKLIVGLSLLNVWLIQGRSATQWRGGSAKTLREEFEVYGLPEWSFLIIGILKVGLALLLISSIWYSPVQKIAALGLAVLLTGSVVMHLKVNDPLKKSLPAFTFLIICLVIAFGNSIFPSS